MYLQILHERIWFIYKLPTQQWCETQMVLGKPNVAGICTDETYAKKWTTEVHIY